MNRVLVVLCMALSVLVPHGAGAGECTPRTLVLSAFPGEIDLLLRATTGAATQTIDDRVFTVGSLRGNPVVLTLTGIGLVNAERATREAIEHFGCADGSGIARIVFSGVSGGRTSIGDVTVPARWSFDGQSWLAVDAAMLDVARAVAQEGVVLERRTPSGDLACVGADPRAAHTVELDQPEIIVGGDGRSADPFGGRAFPCWPGAGDVFGCRPCSSPGASAGEVERFATEMVPFFDPAFFFGFFQNPPATSGADADDMETASVAKVAAEHGIPFIAFRALSDGDGDPLMLPGFPFQFFYYRQLAADNAARVTLAFLQAWAQV